MAVQVGRPVTKPAPGDAPATGNPGPSPAPVKEFDPTARDRSMGRTSYGANASAFPSSISTGHKVSSPTADMLKAKNAEGDGGDLLQRIIERGTSRGPAADAELQSPQTRAVSKDAYPTSFGLAKRGGGGSPSGQVPTHCGAPVTDDRYAEGVKRTTGK